MVEKCLPQISIDIITFVDKICGKGTSTSAIASLLAKKVNNNDEVLLLSIGERYLVFRVNGKPVRANYKQKTLNKVVNYWDRSRLSLSDLNRYNDTLLLMVKLHDNTKAARRLFKIKKKVGKTK